MYEKHRGDSNKRLPLPRLRPTHMASHEVKSEGYSSEAHVKREYSGDEVAVAEEGGLSDPNHVDLHRALKARHITMIGT